MMIIFVNICHNMLKDDWYWNKLYSKPLKKWEALYVYLKNRQETKKIWTYYADKGILKVVRDRDEHFHQKSQSYGFSDIVVKTLPPETIIELKQKWWFASHYTRILNILVEWKYLFFATQWYEKQLFMPLENFKYSITQV